jgi:hypothetical protein
MTANHGNAAEAIGGREKPTKTGVTALTANRVPVPVSWTTALNKIH